MALMTLVIFKLLVNIVINQSKIKKIIHNTNTNPGGNRYR